MTIRAEKIVTILAVLGVLVGLAQAREKDHSADYQVGTFSSTGTISDGSYANCSGGAVRLTAQRITSTTSARRMGCMRLKPPRQWQALCLLG